MNKPKLASVVIARLGFLDALYLLMIKLTQEPAFCIQGIGDCWSVNTSVYSQIFGIPVALLGTLAFLTLQLIFMFETRIGFLNEYSKYILFGITLVGVLYSAYLTYLEIAVIEAICPFCILSAISMGVLFILSVIRLVQNQQ